MPYDERWLAGVLAKGQVRLVGSGAAGDRGRESADTPGRVRPHVSEAVFQSAVVRVAKDAGWTFVYHTYRSTRSPSGFPDLLLCHCDPGHVCYAIECKTDTGQVTPAQEAWLTALAGSTGVVSAVWRPAMWDEIYTRLRDV